jgi:hypothetical protein
MPLVGYARVSTEEQVANAQTDVLKAAGYVEIFREHMSGAKASRPELAKALARVRRGDVLVVARLDRLARSLSHLLSVIAELDAKGAHFKSLADPIDTTTPQGRFALQVLGAVAARFDPGAHQGRLARRRSNAAASAAIQSSAPATATPSSASSTPRRRTISSASIERPNIGCRSSGKCARITAGRMSCACSTPSAMAPPALPRPNGPSSA